MKTRLMRVGFYGFGEVILCGVFVVGATVFGLSELDRAAEFRYIIHAWGRRRAFLKI